MADNFHEGTPSARKGNSNAISTWQEFDNGLKQREQELSAMLPAHVSPAKFYATSVAAVKQNPELLQCTPRSLMTSITKAAQDGLQPDGREGVITIYNTKVKGRNGAQDRWEKIAQWNPMSHGLRKRAKELDNIIIDAQVVYRNDMFKRTQGDDPKIIHEPVNPGDERGPLVAAYAIFRKEGEILHRETMSSEDVEKTRAQSKSPDSLMWKKFTEEGYKKTVLRRGIKSVPVSEKLEAVIRRDDENFHFSDAARPAAAPLLGRSESEVRPDPAKYAERKDGQPADGLVVEDDADDFEEGDFEEHDDADQGNAGAGEGDKEKDVSLSDIRNTIKEKEARDAAAAKDKEKPPADKQPAATVKPDEQEEVASVAFLAAEGMIEKMKAIAADTAECPNLDEFKKTGRINIDSLDGITDDERDMLRGRFTTIILEAKRAREKTGKAKK